MPAGFERLNVRRRPPNANITFITPLPGPTEATALDLLERVAAIVYPIMKQHHLTVTSLVEYPANPSFWGRNFNAGEKIELVLRHPRTRSWLPFAFVVAVMLHELSHNVHMDHSARFWACKRGFDAEMQALRDRGYTGEGFWSRGRKLWEDGGAEAVLEVRDLPVSLCGGTYRERRTKRAKREKPSYQEQKKRRIERKFGVRGERLGEGEETEKKGRPRVAGSKRGRELRAAAALRRVEAQKENPETEEVSEGEEEDEDEEVVEVEGKWMVSVSGEADGKEEEEAKGRELRELLGGCGTGEGPHGIEEKRPPPAPAPETLPEKSAKGKERAPPKERRPPPASAPEAPPETSAKGKERAPPKQRIWCELSDDEPAPPQKPQTKPPQTDTKPPELQTKPPERTPAGPQIRTCNVCTTENAPGSTVCAVCSNLLAPGLHADAWKCGNKQCNPEYTNVGDVRYCGICGSARS